MINIKCCQTAINTGKQFLPKSFQPTQALKLKLPSKIQMDAFIKNNNKLENELENFKYVARCSNYESDPWEPGDCHMAHYCII